LELYAAIERDDAGEDESRGTLELYAALEREDAGVIAPQGPGLAHVLSDTVRRLGRIAR
jgi:hypothetical protein